MQKLLLLPAQITPADAALKRRHAPRSVEKDYPLFRDCLRWEFGFTCAICLLHERDLMSYGVDGWGVTQIEHLVPRSHDGSLVGVYTNVLYVCRLCNGARSDTDLEDNQGRHLLDPTKDIWSEHFRLENDNLVPIDGDVHAEYTADVYAVNEPRKVKLRRIRRERINIWDALIGMERSELAQLKTRIRCADHLEELTLAQAIMHIQEKLDHLYRLLPGGPWVPDDAPGDCRCGRVHARSLPAPYLRQVVEFDLP